MSKYKVIQELKIAITWGNATSMPEMDIDTAKEIFHELRRVDPTVLVMGQQSASRLMMWMRMNGFGKDSSGGLGFYLYRHQLPPRFMDMKVLVIPVEFSFMLPELGDDVWVVYQDEVVVLKETLNV